VIGDRVERLRAGLEDPFLVSDPINLRYLTGLDSSNAALLVEADRIRLFADFRYAESARAVEGVECVERARDLFPRLSELLVGRLGCEASSGTSSPSLARRGFRNRWRGGLVLRQC
jgi:Xaa-Pro aminopeptidase